MLIKQLFLQNFRNYQSSLLEFNPKINFIYGENAQGKTSILEAIYFLLIGRSFRTHQPSDMISQGSNNFFVETQFVKHGVEQKLKIASNGKERKIFYNSTPCPSVNSLLGLLTGVLITPNDDLIKGSPQARRSFVDLHISQSDPLYLHHLTRYHKALKHRNQLLKLKKFETMNSWEEEMANAAAYVTLNRAKAIELLGKSSQRLYKGLSTKSQVLKTVYNSKAMLHSDIKEFYLAEFRRMRPRESIVGATLVGPHKDEILIQLEDRDARLFASEGQQRIAIAALRLASWHRLKDVVEEPPLLLIDDVGISLDYKHRQKLWEYLSSLGQVFLTSTEKSAFPITTSQNFCIQISQGEVISIENN